MSNSYQQTGITIRVKHIYMSNIPKPKSMTNQPIKSYNIDAVAKFHYFIKTV